MTHPIANLGMQEFDLDLPPDALDPKSNIDFSYEHKSD